MTQAPPGGTGGPDGYEDFAARLVAGGILRDPWIDGRPRFQQAPVIVEAARYRELVLAAEETAAACHAVVSLLLDEPRLLDDALGLTPAQRAMWTASAPSWHGIARADVFATKDGIAVAEINCDTPTGEAEAVILGELAMQDAKAARPRRGSSGDLAASLDTGLFDPSKVLEERFLRMLAYVSHKERVVEAGPTRTVGLVYPTELTDDLPLVRLYQRWLEGKGYGVVLGSPYNLTFEDGRTHLFDTPIDVLVRHYKTDWWGERESAWLGEKIADAEPLDGPLRAVLSGMATGTLAVVNPFGAVVPQNKRCFAVMWEQVHRLPPDAQAAVQKWVPVTKRLEVMHTEQLLAQKGAWVLKSDYGAEGEEVVVGREVDDATWKATLQRARPRRWVAQQYFEAERGGAGESVNYGVFLVAGKASGLYARVQVGATDARAMSAPAVVRA